MIIRVVEHPLNHERRRLAFYGCADEFAKASNNDKVRTALDKLKHGSDQFITVRDENNELLYFIEKEVM